LHPWIFDSISNDGGGAMKGDWILKVKNLLGLLPYKGEIEWAKGIKIGYVPQRLPFIKDIPLNIKDFFRLKIGSL
jgi:hypothetical protein